MKTAFIYNIFKRWAFLGAVIFMIILNALSSIIPFGGQTMAEVSAKYPTLITPAGYAFSIWGVIYLALLLFAVYQLQRRRQGRFNRVAWPFFITNALANGLWLIAFQNEWLAISVVLMGIVLFTLIAIMAIFYRVRKLLGTTNRFFFQVPFSMYLGWISVASAVNVAAWLVSLNLAISPSSAALIAMTLLIVLALLGLWILFSQQDYIYALTLVWALVAIWLVDNGNALVEATAKFASLALLLSCAVYFILDRVKVAQYGRRRFSQDTRS